MAKSSFQVYTVDISGITWEKRIEGSGDPMHVETLEKSSKAVCKIKVDNDTGTGFLAKFPATDGSLIYGIFTNNHVVSEHNLADGKTFTTEFDTVAVDNVPLTLDVWNNEKFRFTCSVLDVTFVRFEGELLRNLLSYGCQFLEVAESEFRELDNSGVVIFQHPGGDKISIAQGVFLEHHGIDMFHLVSTDYGSSGSPVALTSGLVIGIHKAQAAQSCNNYNVAVSMKTVIKAIRPFFCHPFIPRLFGNLTTYDITYADKLLEIGLQKCFIQQGSKFQGVMYLGHAKFVDDGQEVVTRIWYVPTSHGWYWTPTNPSDEEKETNWMPVSQWQVIGGYWHRKVPETEIINWLYQHNIVRKVFPPA